MAEPASPQAGVLAHGAHVFPLRVYYEDTDAAGIVYYANYLKFAERARTEMMHLLDAGYGALIRDGRLGFAVRRCEVEFVAPARLDEVIEVVTRVRAARGASVEADQVVRRGRQELAKLRVRLACLDAGGRVARIPARLRAALAGLAAAGPVTKASTTEGR